MTILSFQEKCLYAELLGTATFLGVLLAYGSFISSDSHGLSWALVAYSVVYFGYSFLMNRRSRFQAGDYLIDERDWMIESKGIRVSHAVLLVGVIYFILRIEDAPELSSLGLVNRLLVLLMVASVARIVRMLRLYRTSA